MGVCTRFYRASMGLCLGALFLSSQACGEVPPCPYLGEPAYAPSAGCLILMDGKMLVVDSIYGGVSPPGGSTKAGESAQCTAHRETFQEVGLDLVPGDLATVFDTGFHLYHCELRATSVQVILGQWQEITGWRWLPIDEFEQVPWRYAGQGAIMRRLLTGEHNEEN